MNNQLRSIIDFKNSKEWIEFKEYYEDATLTNQLGMFRYEDANTNFLKSILEDQNNRLYNFKYNPMKLFVELIKLNSNHFKNINTYKIEEFESLDISLRNNKDFATTRIPDMTIKFKNCGKSYIIVVEAKLFTKEHDNQCEVYRKSLIDSNYDEKVFVYLTIEGEAGGRCSDDSYIYLTYQDIIDYVYNPLLLCSSNKTAIALDDYVKSFNQLYSQLNSDKVVLTSKGKELTLNIWKAYESLFNTIFTSQELLDEFSVYYNENRNLFRILFINIIRILGNSNEPNIQLINHIGNIVQKTKTAITIDGVPVSNSRFTYEILKRIFTDKLEMSIEGFNSKFTNTKYYYAYNEEDYLRLEHYQNCYSYDYYDVLLDNNDNKVYYMIAINDKEIEELITVIKKYYPKYMISRDEKLTLIKE